MEPITDIALSLALGAGAIAGKEIVGAVVKDAYAKLKGLIAGRYPSVSVEPLEKAPHSERRRTGVEADLTEAGAGGDAEVLAAARDLIQAIRQHAPEAAAAIGVDLKEVEAVNLRLADIASSGTGVRVERAKLSGDIDIQGVRAGVPPKAG